MHTEIILRIDYCIFDRSRDWIPPLLKINYEKVREETNRYLYGGKKEMIELKKEQIFLLKSIIHLTLLGKLWSQFMRHILEPITSIWIQSLHLLTKARQFKIVPIWILTTLVSEEESTYSPNL